MENRTKGILAEKGLTEIGEKDKITPFVLFLILTILNMEKEFIVTDVYTLITKPKVEEDDIEERVGIIELNGAVECVAKNIWRRWSIALGTATNIFFLPKYRRIVDTDKSIFEQINTGMKADLSLLSPHGGIIVFSSKEMSINFPASDLDLKTTHENITTVRETGKHPYFDLVQEIIMSDQDKSTIIGRVFRDISEEIKIRASEILARSKNMDNYLKLKDKSPSFARDFVYGILEQAKKELEAKS